MVYTKFTCKDCTKREVGCHIWCEDYIRDKAKHEEAREIERVEKEKDSMRYEGIIRHMAVKEKRRKRAMTNTKIYGRDL